MITFTGLVFSITIVVLQLTSSQFSPRVLRTFLRDRQTQLSLGVLVARWSTSFWKPGANRSSWASIRDVMSKVLPLGTWQ